MATARICPVRRYRLVRPWRGHGAAMRVAPVGAYFADDPDAVVEQAGKSAKVTHAHPEGVAGAVAVALAAALACRLHGGVATADPRDFLDLTFSHMPESAVREGIRQARDLPSDPAISTAVVALGNGGPVSAQDTLPFTRWCAAQYLDNYEEALWATSTLGDRDTKCAILGGIVACFTGEQGIPEPWRLACM
ncbi:MAG TPA: ADP-ribosylglycohydrolase family protein [Ktedonobacterales bacterium]|nr:ADP-ribosylglycohydrolase family protein [Ktedonobacterales bacterium]